MLDPEGRIPPATATALRRLYDLGVRIILASGRMSARVLPYIHELGLDLDLIAYNGAEVRECRNGEWMPVLSRTLSDRTRDTVFALCRDHGHFLNVYAGGLLHGYHPAGDFRGGEFYAAQTRAEYAARGHRLEFLPKEGILKLLVVETPATRDRLYREWEPGLRTHCQVLKSNPEYLEFVDLGTSKGSALAFWLNRNGLSSGDLLAFGDAENDLDMLRMAGLGIAMANATPGLRAGYDRFSRWTHAEEGVARELATLYPL